jgi:hypothetical protein
MSFRLYLPRAAALLLALAWPGAAGARAADSLSDVMDDFIDQLTESQREPLARELAEPRAECESDGEGDALPAGGAARLPASIWHGRDAGRDRRSTYLPIAPKTELAKTGWY